jgi:hypothetical protein
MKDGKAHLTELAEEPGVVVGFDRRLGKRGMLGIKNPLGDPDREVSVGGKTDRNALTLSPSGAGDASVKYHTDGKAEKLEGEVALNDGERPQSPATFEVLGDGTSLWKSKPMQTPGEKQKLDVNVRGIKVLELRVHYFGQDNKKVFAVWLDARVTSEAPGRRR